MTLKNGISEMKMTLPLQKKNIIKRKQLLQRVDDALKQGGVVLSAPAGYGKTTLLSQWAHCRAVTPAWLSLDRQDNEPLRFQERILRALRRAYPDIQQVMPEAEMNTGRQNCISFCAQLIDKIQYMEKDIVLIIDDIHFLEHEIIIPAVFYLMKYTAPNFHIVMAARGKTRFPIEKFSLNDTLTVITAAEMAFTREETRFYFRNMAKREVNDALLNKIIGRTAGWPCGLRMIFRGLQGPEKPSEMQLHASIDDLYITAHDYFIEEVLAAEPENIRSFLIHTSILETLSVDMCAAVTGRPDAHAVLEYIKEFQLFVFPINSMPGYYRCHPLFRDVLYHQLLGMPGQQLTDLHLRASAAYAGVGDGEHAIRHAIRGKDPVLISALIERFAASFLLARKKTALPEWFGLLTVQQVESSPRLSILYAWCLLEMSPCPDFVRIEQLVEKAANRFQTIATEDDMRGAFAKRFANDETAKHYIALKARLMREQGESTENIIAFANEAVTCLDASESLLRSDMFLCLAMAHMANSDWDLGLKYLIEAIHRARQGNAGRVYTVGIYLYGLIQRFRGRSKAAADIFTEALTEAAENAPAMSGPAVFVSLMRTGKQVALLESGRLDAVADPPGMSASRIKALPDPEIISGAVHDTVRAKILYGCPVAEVFEILDRADILDPLEIRRPGVKCFAGVLKIAVLLRGGAPSRQTLSQARRICRQCDLTFQNVLTSEKPNCLTELWRHLGVTVLVRLYLSLDKKNIRRMTADDFEKMILLLDVRMNWSACNGMEAFEVEAMICKSLLLLHRKMEDDAIKMIKRMFSIIDVERFAYIFSEIGLPLENLLACAAGHGVAVYEIARILKNMKRMRARSESIPDYSGQADIGIANIEKLSKREMEVLRLIAVGLSNPEIAAQLYLAKDTVKRHVSNIYGKLNVNNRVQAVSKADEMNIL